MLAGLCRNSNDTPWLTRKEQLCDLVMREAKAALLAIATPFGRRNPKDPITVRGVKGSITLNSIDTR